MRVVIAEGVTNRSSIFVTTKISPATCTAVAALSAIRADLQQLALALVDLVLHHFACDTDAENQAIWRGMMQAKDLGLARAIGVSSYSVLQLQGLLSMKNAVKPAVNQCQMKVGDHDDETIDFCQAKGIT